MLRRKKYKLVFRCMVWFVNDFADRLAIPSDAYGQFQEHTKEADAINELAALRMTSLKMSTPSGAFWAAVVAYPQGAPPKSARREVYMVLGGE